jgi:hypothetical protein
MTTKRRRSCAKKQRHPTRAAAEQQLSALIRKRGASPYYMHVYKCRYCGAYHVGHRIGAGKRL